MKVGDRVKYIGRHPGMFKETGTVVGISIEYAPFQIGIDFDEDIKGHSCGGLGRLGHCMWIDIDAVELIDTDENQPKIKWYSKGRFDKWENK